MKLRFVIVGRPNKGKSSLVATLAQNDRVPISPRSGTTTRADSYALDIPGHSLEFVDTPGFQRPSRMLRLLHQRAGEIGAAADRRAAVLAAFIADEAKRGEFPDEIELLGAIVGAADSVATALIYVVDGSTPYDPAYEAEMSILQWTGKPSIAIVNPIEGGQFAEQWQAALNHFFKLVRVFDPCRDDAASRIRLLEDFSHIDPAWRQPLGRIIAALGERRSADMRRSAEIAADLLSELCGYRVRQLAPDERSALALRPLLEERFFGGMRQRESAAHDALQAVYRHESSIRVQMPLALDGDLFDTRRWSLWGLGRRRLTLAGAGTGALAGAGIDALVGGMSLGAASTLGALLGAAGAWFGGETLASLHVGALAAGGFEAVQGPVRNPNFPYVLLGRLLCLHRALCNRSHARRDELRLEEDDALQARIERLDPSQQRRLHAALRSLMAGKEVEAFGDILFPLFSKS